MDNMGSLKHHIHMHKINKLDSKVCLPPSIVLEQIIHLAYVQSNQDRQNVVIKMKLSIVGPSLDLAVRHFLPNHLIDFNQFDG